VPQVQTTIIESLASFDRAHVADRLLQTKAADGKLADADLQALAAVDVTADSLITHSTLAKLYHGPQAAARLAMLSDPRAVPPLD